MDAIPCKQDQQKQIFESRIDVHSGPSKPVLSRIASHQFKLVSLTVTSGRGTFHREMEASTWSEVFKRAMPGSNRRASRLNLEEIVLSIALHGPLTILALGESR